MLLLILFYCYAFINNDLHIAAGSVGRHKRRFGGSHWRRSTQVHPAAQGHRRHRGRTGEVRVPRDWPADADHQVVQRTKPDRQFTRLPGRHRCTSNISL